MFDAVEFAKMRFLNESSSIADQKIIWANVLIFVQLHLTSHIVVLLLLLILALQMFNRLRPVTSLIVNVVILLLYAISLGGFVYYMSPARADSKNHVDLGSKCNEGGPKGVEGVMDDLKSKCSMLRLVLGATVAVL